jgi:hypothetical protein
MNICAAFNENKLNNIVLKFTPSQGAKKAKY